MSRPKPTPFCGRNAWMIDRDGIKVSNLSLDPFWVRPKDWVDWMINVNQINYLIDVQDGFGGSVSGDLVSELTSGPPVANEEPTIYRREQRWIPKGEGDNPDYLDAYNSLRVSTLSFPDKARTAKPYPPSDYNRADIELNPINGSYGNYGVQAWREWPLFDTNDFSYTTPVVSVSNNSQIATNQSLWRKAWEQEDIEEGMPNPGWRYQIPFFCEIGVELGHCGPVFVSENFDPNTGPVPIMPIYEDVFEGGRVDIGGNAYLNEIENSEDFEEPEDPFEIPSDYQEIEVDFILTALSGDEYTMRARVQSGLESARTQTDPSTEYNDGTPFNTTGEGEYAAYSMSGEVRINLQKV